MSNLFRVIFKVQHFIIMETCSFSYVSNSVPLCPWCIICSVRDRPFNLQGGYGFLFHFSDNTRVRILIFFCRTKRKFFFQNLTLGYMTKTLKHVFFCFLHQNQNIFFSNIGNQNIFLEKKTIPSHPPSS